MRKGSGGGVWGGGGGAVGGIATDRVVKELLVLRVHGTLNLAAVVGHLVEDDLGAHVGVVLHLEDLE